MLLKIDNRLIYEKRKCKICGYIYDAKEGDKKHLIAPNTPFEKLPSNWRCPVCKYPKSAFYIVENEC